MKKFKNLFIIIFVFLLSITLFAENSTQKKEIRAIEVQGLKNVKQRVVKNVIKIDTGEDFDQKLVDEDISAIYKLGYFSDVAADVSDYKDGVKVIFIVQEKLIVKKIDFKGNKEYSSRKLNWKSNEYDAKQSSK